VVGSVAVDGVQVASTGVDGERLAEFVRARTGAIRACYEARLRIDPGLEGRIRVRFRILETGGISDVTAKEDTLGSPDVAACVIAVMRTWRSPFRPPEAVPVEYPFHFTVSR
jgi:TonB family protein